MEIVLNKEENKRKRAIVSLVIHALLLLLFAFWGLTYLDPPPDEGMLINFGYAETGLGKVESEPAASSSEKEPVREEVPVPPVATPPVQPQSDPVVTQDTEEEIALKREKEAKEKAEAERKREEERKRKEEERLRAEQQRRMEELFAKAKAGESKDGGGEGDTKPGGNQGSPDGVPGVPHGGKGGSGSGFSFDLGGRRITAPPRIEDRSQEKGKVVVDIAVDRYGKVIEAIPGGRGSTTTSTHLYGLARDAALNTRFSANPDAQVQQRGSMTFVFVVE